MDRDCGYVILIQTPFERELYWTPIRRNGRCTVPSTDKSGSSVFATVIISTQKEVGLFSCRNTDIVWSSGINDMNTVSSH